MNHTKTKALEMLDLKRRGYGLKDIAEAYGYSLNYVRNLIAMAQAHERVFADQIEQWKKTESRILRDCYMDWLTFLAEDKK